MKNEYARVRHNSDQSVTVNIPKPTPKRFRWIRRRLLEIDFRGIKEPNKDMRLATRVSNAAQLWHGPKDLERRVNEYFDSCHGPVYNNKTGDFVRNPDGSLYKAQLRPYTLTGLARSLGISRGLLLNYRKGLIDEVGFSQDQVDQYSAVLDRAKQRVEEYLEGMLLTQEGSRGSQFNLDVNFNWITKRDLADIELKLASAEAARAKLDKDDEDNSNTINVNIVRKKKIE